MKNHFQVRERWHRLLLLVAVLLLIANVSACGDNETTSQSDATERMEDSTQQNRLFPLPDDWKPVAADAMNEYGGLNDSDDTSQFNDPATLDRLREEYKKCEVAVDDDGLVRARCTEEVTWSFVNPCPRGRFVALTQPPLYVEESEWAYCLQDDFDQSIRNCRKRDCSSGYVCEGTLRDADDDSIFDQIAFCVTPSRCIAVKVSITNAGEAACFYDDLTFAETGVIAEQDCSQLAEGECAINCPCSGGSGRCRFLSETRPVGLCASELCGGGTDSKCTSFSLGECMHLADPPEWASNIIAEEYEDDVRRGYCVARDRCELTQARYPGDYNCGYGDD